ncbi:arsenate reductase (glutaredoxin) [Orbus mooreae]|uniref:arsenate reductase (glutaredoxin) n=1 Tax=Orbus mooreae TaxID=3074107 RepID=UPI00370DBC48
MSTTTIYHNPKCSKSRETLALLQSHHVEPNVVLYLEHPPTVSTIKQLLNQLGFTSARQLMRTKEDLYKELNLDDETLTEEALINAMHQHPELIERPIVIVKNRAKIGRPPENVLTLIE